MQFSGGLGAGSDSAILTLTNDQYAKVRSIAVLSQFGNQGVRFKSSLPFTLKQITGTTTSPAEFFQEIDLGPGGIISRYNEAGVTANLVYSMVVYIYKRPA